MEATNYFVSEPAKKVFGMVAQFSSPHALLEAVSFVRKAGFRRLDTHTPFPIHGMDKALDLPPSRLPWLVLLGALFGTMTGIFIQVWMNGIDYPLRVGGKSFFAYQSYLPVAFELTILFGALTAVFGMFALNRLPQPYHALFTHAKFGRATDDAFFLSIDARDPKWDEQVLRGMLERAGGKDISVVFEEGEGR